MLYAAHAIEKKCREPNTSKSKNVNNQQLLHEFNITNEVLL